MKVQDMNAEELYQRGVSLIEDIEEGVESGQLVPLANAFLQAAQTRSTMDAQTALVAGMESVTKPAQLPVTNFAPAKDQNDNTIYVNEHGSVLSWPDRGPTMPAPESEWRQLYVRVTS